MKAHLHFTERGINRFMLIAALSYFILALVACNNQSPYNEETGPVKVVKSEKAKPSSDTLYYKHVNTKTK